MAVKARSFDFSGVKDRSQFNPKHMAEGDYLATVTLVDEQKSKEKGETMWVFGIQLEDTRSAVYPYYCNIENENQLWKLRNLFLAAGISVPKRAAKLDPNKIVGKQLGVSLEDDEYEGKMKSVINGLMLKSELVDYADVDTDEDAADEDDFEEEEVEETPKRKRKAKVEPEPEEDDEEEEDEEPAPKPVSKRTAKRRAEKAAAAAAEEEDDEEEEEAPKKRKAKAAPAEEEDDDLDLEFDEDDD